MSQLTDCAGQVTEEDHHLKTWVKTCSQCYASSISDAWALDYLHLIEHLHENSAACVKKEKQQFQFPVTITIYRRSETIRTKEITIFTARSDNSLIQYTPKKKRNICMPHQNANSLAHSPNKQKPSTHICFS